MGVAMVKKKKQKVPMWALSIVAVLVVAGLVFVGLSISHNKKDYSEVQSELSQLAEGREETERFLSLEVKSAKLNDEEKKIVEDFEKVVPEDGQIQRILQSINDINADQSEDIKKAVDEIALAYIDLHTLYLCEKDMSVMYDGELSEDDLVALEKSDYDYLANIAKDVGGYRAKVKKLSANDKEFEKNYKTLLEEGDNLKRKYTGIKLENVIGKKKEAVLAFFDGVDELNKLLQEQE